MLNAARIEGFRLILLHKVEKEDKRLPFLFLLMKVIIKKKLKKKENILLGFRCKIDVKA